MGGVFSLLLGIHYDRMASPFTVMQNNRSDQSKSGHGERREQIPQKEHMLKEARHGCTKGESWKLAAQLI